MARTPKNVGWVTRNDGEHDQRYTMPQVLNGDGSRDRRFNLFQQPNFESSEVLTRGYSQYYNPTNAPSGPGVYQMMTTDGMGRPTAQYSGMSKDVNRRLNQHGYGGSDNISWQMHQANYRGMDVRVRYAEADNALEARAQEKYLLGQRDFNWNSKNNDGNVRYWWP